MKTTNNDTGSLHVGNTLPKEFQKQGVPGASLKVLIEGEKSPRAITYIMGSEKKGWHLCAKGSGPFPSTQTGNGEVEFEYIAE